MTTDAFDFLLTVSNGLREAAEELVVLGQSEGSTFGLLKGRRGCKTRKNTRKSRDLNLMRPDAS